MDDTVEGTSFRRQEESQERFRSNVQFMNGHADDKVGDWSHLGFRRDEEEILLPQATASRGGMKFPTPEEPARGYIKPEHRTPVNKRAEILREAERLINGDRAQAYGPPQDSFGRIADLLNAMGVRIRDTHRGLADVEHRRVNPVDVSLMLIQLKVSRTIGQPKSPDNWTDMAGYTGLGAELALPGPADLKENSSEKPLYFSYFWDASDSSPVAVTYYYRCDECGLKLAHEELAAHAWTMHQVRDWVASTVLHQGVVPNPRPLHIYYTAVQTKHKRGLFRKPMIFTEYRCSECKKLIEEEYLGYHVDRVHPEFKDFDVVDIKLV